MGYKGIYNKTLKGLWFFLKSEAISYQMKKDKCDTDLITKSFCSYKSPRWTKRNFRPLMRR